MGLPIKTNNTLVSSGSGQPSQSEIRDAANTVNSQLDSAQDSGPGQATTSETPNGSIGGTKSEAELAAERLYEERMEDEYAKREGGA
jgi:hypothetical protein